MAVLELVDLKSSTMLYANGSTQTHGKHPLLVFNVHECMCCPCSSSCFCSDSLAEKKHCYLCVFLRFDSISSFSSDFPFSSQSLSLSLCLASCSPFYPIDTNGVQNISDAGQRLTRRRKITHHTLHLR
jgi:hypothetical protein